MCAEMHTKLSELDFSSIALTNMTESTMYCGICGGPFRGSRCSPRDEEWLSRIVLLSSEKPVLQSEEKVLEHYLVKDPDLAFGTVSSDGIYVTTASADEDSGGNGFRLLNDDSVQLCCDIHSPYQLLIGIHEACLLIAKHVIRIRAISSCTDLSVRRVDSMRTLWDMLESRYRATVKSTGFLSPATLLDSPNNYHMGKGRLHWWDENYNSEGLQESELYESDPVDIINISDKILQHLQALPLESTTTASPPPSPSHVRFKSLLEGLPIELIEQITEMLAPMHNSPLQCTRLLHHSDWLQGLLGGKLLPYLWDLDTKHVQEKLRKGGVTEWDFERLVRLLAQEGIWEYFGRRQTDPALLSIRNRRRIWKLVEDMEIGDVQPVIVPPNSCDNTTCPLHHGQPSDDTRKCTGNLIDYRKLYPELYQPRWNIF